MDVSVIGRDEERNTIRSYLQSRLGMCASAKCAKRGKREENDYGGANASAPNAAPKELVSKSALYLCGAPGTGKTASVKSVLSESEFGEMKSIFVNSNTFQNTKEIFPYILKEVTGDMACLSASDADVLRELGDLLFPKKKTRKRKRQEPVVLVIDEIDRLLEAGARDQDVLYRLFEWPLLPNSRVILVGIANAVDLSDKFLPRLRERGREPQLLIFSAYTSTELARILKHHLKQLVRSDESFRRGSERDLAEFFDEGYRAARRMAKSDGDARKALDICLKAYSEARKETTKCSLKHVIGVMNAIHKSPAVAAIQRLPQQSQLALCTAMRMRRKLKKSQTPTAKELYSEYKRMCGQSGNKLFPVGRSEFYGALLSQLEGAGLVKIVKKSDPGKRKVSLFVQPEDVKAAFAQHPLLSRLMLGK